jgi:hypothetical protein
MSEAVKLTEHAERAARLYEVLAAINRAAGGPTNFVARRCDEDESQAFILSATNYRQQLAKVPEQSWVEVECSGVPDALVEAAERAIDEDEIEGFVSKHGSSAALITVVEVDTACGVSRCESITRLMRSCGLDARFRPHDFRGKEANAHIGIIANFGRPLGFDEYADALDAIRRLAKSPAVATKAEGTKGRYRDTGSRLVDWEYWACGTNEGWWSLDLTSYPKSGGVADPKRLVSAATRWDAVGQDFEIYRNCGSRKSRARGAERVEMLVDGLVPRGSVTLLAAAQESGKSTLATELAAAVATGKHSWLGQRLSCDGGLAVLLSGEDSIGIVNERLAALDPEDAADRLVVYAMDNRPFSDICESLLAIPKLDLLIVDPARRYLVGDEDGSDTVNTFFSQLEDVARRKNSGVLVAHHLTKNVRPQSLQQLREAIRGSSLFTDRPRVVLGMLRRSAGTLIGVAKHNLPPSCEMMDEALFIRDAATLRHLPKEASSPVARNVGSVADAPIVDRVIAAVTRLAAEGVRMYRTGSRELWALEPVELAGVGRNRVRETVDGLVEAGRLIVGAGGSLGLAEA